MGHYNNATICLNGHVVSKYQANYQKFCSKCGKETYSKCPECNSPIHGKYEVDGIVDLSGSYNRPDYCYNCGAPYPWTKIILDNAVMLVSLEDELDESMKELIKTAIPDLITETPATPIAIAKYKKGMRFDEILRASLTMPTIMGIAQYISDCKNPSKNQMHSNAGNQTRNSYTVVYIFGDNENEIRDVLIEKLSASNISCKRVGGQEIIERCHEDISVKKKYIIAFSEMASLCITKASELLGENIIINRIFLINPSKAKESDLYLGDISIIDGNSVAIKSWEKAVLGNVREFESNSNDIFDIIMRELENDK